MNKDISSINGKIDNIDAKLDMLTEKLLNPDTGVTARVNRNTSMRKVLVKAMWVIYTVTIGAIITGKDWYCIQFPVESVIASLTVGNMSGTEAALVGLTLPAGTTLFMRFTAIQLTSGVGIGYRESDGETAS
mgnify:CR=1 FL=1